MGDALTPRARLTVRKTGLLFAVALSSAISALPVAAQQVTVEDVTESSATLNLSGHTGSWSYREMTPSVGTCAVVADGNAASLSQLSEDVAYTYQVFSATSCALGNQLGEVRFTTLGFSLTEKTRTTATLTLDNYPTGQAWWYKESWPSAGQCTSAGTGTNTTVSGLTENTSYTYHAYEAADCGSDDWIGVEYFKTLPTNVLDYDKLTRTTVELTLVNATIAWQHKKTEGPGAVTCTDVPQGTQSVEVSGLTANTDYTFTAYRDRGSSCSEDTLIDWVDFTTLPPPPKEPTLLSATARIEGAALSWTSGGDSGSPITGWKYRHKTGNTWGDWTAISGSGASTTSHTVTGLTGGTTYTFQVRAVNRGGDGTASNESTSVTALVKPDVNLSLSVTSLAEDASATEVTVTAAFSNTNTFTSDKTVTVTVGGSGTATSGTDYAAVSDFDITISKGTGSATGTFTLTPTDDASVEGSETVGVSGSATGLTVNSVSLTLTEDDAATVTVNDADADEGDGITFTVTLSAAVQGGLTVTPSYTNGTAEDGDYTANTTALSFTGTANETKTFTVSTAEDAVLEDDETFTVGLTVTNAPSGVTSTDTGTGTINNDDAATVTVNDADADEGDEITFTVTLSAAVQGGLTVTPSYTNGTAASADYTANTTALSFTGTANETKTFTVSTAEDAVLEDDETFTVGLSVSDAPSGVTSTDTGTGTINNDDAAAVTVNDADADEGDEITFTVTLSAAVQGGLKVTPSYTNGTAASADYTANTTALSFTGTANETKTFTVSTTEDQVAESDETFTVGLTVSDAPSGVTSTDTGTGTIDDDDGSSVNVTVNNASASEGDAMTFTVTLSKAVQGGLTVTPSYTNGTAASGDYTANTTALSFTGTANETKTFTVSTTEDAVLEANETFTVGLSVSNTSLTIDATDTGTGTINNDDAATVTVNDADADEGDEITFTVTLSAAVQGGLTVTPSYTNGTAASTDYTANTTGLSFTGTANETKTFTVSTTEDAVVEANETFTVGLAVSNTSITVDASDTGTGTINNDDNAAVTVNDASASEGAAMTFTVTLSAAVQGGLKVTPGYANGTAASTDYTANTTALSLTGTANETKTFTVSTTEDVIVEPNETFTVGLTVSNAPSGVTSTDTGTGTINNDDAATVTVNDADADEGDAMTFTVTLDKAVQGGLKVTPSYTNGTAASTDYTANTTALSFTGTANETKTFTVSTTEDQTAESDETFTVGLTVSNAPSGVTATDTGTGTIDDDDRSSLNVTVNNASASEGDAMTFTVTLSAAVQGGLTVTPGYTNGTAASTDYTANTTGLSFTGTANETKTFTVSTTEDAVVEANETFTVGLAVSNTSITVDASDTGTGTINNDDNAAVTVNDASASEGAAMTFTVTLSAAVQGGLKVTPGYANGTAASTDYTANTTALSLTGTANETKTFTVSTTEDVIVEPNETFTVGLTVSNAPSGVTSTDTGTGTINNDDAATVTVNDADADEGDAMTFTVTLDKAVQGGLKVTPSYTNGTAASTDYTANTTALSFTGTANETKTFTVSTTEDQTAESDETFTVGLTVSNAPSGVTATDTGTGTIDDDDRSSLNVTVNNASASEGDAMTFTVTLSAAVQGGLTVTPGYTNGTAASTDYTANTTGLSFTGTANETKTFTVSTTEDAVVEANETFTVGLAVSNTSITVDASDTGTGTINNDDNAAVTVNDASASEGAAMTFTVTLSAAVQGGLKVTPGYANGTAASTDYTANTTALSLTGTANETKTFTVSTTEDVIVEPNETFTVGLTVSNAPSGVTSTDTGTGTIDNDDTTPSVDLSVSPTSVAEGAARTVTVTAAFSNNNTFPDDKTVTVSVGSTGTATSGEDYASVSDFDITIRGGQTRGTGTFVLTPTSDGTVEGTETIGISGSATGLTVGATSLGLTDPTEVTQLVLSVGAAQSSVNEGAGEITVSVAAEFSADQTFTTARTVEVSVDGGTATSGVDYVAVSDFDLTIPAGQAGSTATLQLTPIQDNVIEGDETIVVTGDAPGLDVILATITLIDDDAVPEVDLSAVPAQVTEGSETVVTVTAAFTTANTFTSDKVVTVSVGDGTATSGTDFTAVADFDITIPAGKTSGTGTFTLAPVDDDVVEGDETIAISGGAKGLTVNGGSLVLVDRTAEPLRLRVDPEGVSEGASATTVTVTATLPGGGVFAADQTVTVGVGGGTAESDTDYAVVADFELVIAAGTASGTGTFTLSPMQDTWIEGEETINVSGSAADMSVRGAELMLRDDDAIPAVELSANPASVDESVSAAMVTVTAAFTNASTFSEDRKVTVSVGSGTATSGTDFAAVPDFDITIPAGGSSGTGTFSLTPMDDGVVEEDETIELSGAAEGLAVTGTAVTLADDDDGEARARALKLSLAGIGRTIATQAVDVIGGRFEASSRLARAPGGGGALSGAGARGIAAILEAGGVDMRDLGAAINVLGGMGFGGHASGGVGLGGFASGGMGLGGMGSGPAFGNGGAVSLGLGGDGSGGRGWTLWGSGARTDFSGRPDGFSMDGSMDAAYLGVDRTLGSSGVFGVAVSRNQGGVDFADASHLAGDAEARLTTVYPYLRWSPTASTDLWGMVGLGRGDIGMDAGAMSIETPGRLRMAAMGLRNDLARVGALGLAVRADAFTVGMEADEVAGMVGAAEGRAQRARLMLDGSLDLALSSSSRLTPSVEVGARADGGDAETGPGMELGGGLAFANARLGLDIAARARWLAAHRDGHFGEWGGSMSVRRMPATPERGLSFSLEPAWGDDASGIAALWEGRSLRRGAFGYGLGPENAAEPWRPDRLDMEVAYGAGLPGGLGSLRPFGRLMMMGEGSRHVRVGTRIELAGPGRELGGLALELLGEQRARSGGAAVHGAGLNLRGANLRAAGGLFAPFGEVTFEGASGRRVSFGTMMRLAGEEAGASSGFRLELAAEAHRRVGEEPRYGLVLRGASGMD